MARNIREFVQDYDVGPIGRLSVEPALPGAVQHNPISMWPVAGVGEQASSFMEDWYYRIHFIPAAVEIGNLLSNQSRPVVVWNAYFDRRTVQSFSIGNGDGMTVSEPLAAPYQASALGLYTYVLTVSTLGPPSINATLSWSIDGATYQVPVTGRRVVVWPFAPNWASTVDETLEWLTSVESSFGGVEQRFCMREEPRRVLEYQLQVTSGDSGLFESVVFGWSDRLYAVPLWQEQANLTADVPAGANVIPLGSTADLSFEVGGLLTLRQSARVSESIEIESVGASEVVLRKPVERAWPRGSRVFPVMVARLDHPVSMQYIAEDKVAGVVRFVGSPAETPTRTPINAPALLYGGVEVYTNGSNWSSPTTVEYNASYTVVDSETGVYSMRQQAGWPSIVKSHEWLNKSATEATELRQFFSRRRGQLTPAWLPSGTTDFRLAAAVSSSADTMRVVDNDYGALVSMHPARRNIMVQLRNGTRLFRRITGYTPDVDGTAILSVDAPFGVAFEPKWVRRISFLGLYRLATDSVTFSWRTPKVSVVQSNFKLTKPRE